MSPSADTEEVVAVTDDSVTVRKRYAPDEFPVPAIRFEIESDHDSPVSVRLTESIPESFPMDAVGFHPEYHSEQWTAYQDNRVQFTGTVEPDSSLVTVYGIRLDDEFDSSAFLTEPTISVEGGDGGSESTATGVSDSVEDVVSTDRNNAVKEMLTGDSESVPGLDASEQESASDTSDSSEDSEPEIELDIDAAAERVASESAAGTEESSSPDSDEDRDSGTGADATSKTEAESEPERDSGVDSVLDSPDGSRSESDSTHGADSRARSAADGGSYGAVGDSELVSRLASSLRSDSIAAEDLDTIRSELGSSQSGSTAAKLSHLQERVEEVAAYSGALEEFLDEEGTGAQLVADVQEKVESLQSEVSRIETTVESNATAIDELDDSVSKNSDTLDSVRTSVSSLDGDVASVEDSVSNLESSVDRLEDRASGIESDVSANADDIDSIESDLESVSDDVVDILEWRDQLGSMFTDE